jgi:hypothetical protein
MSGKEHKVPLCERAVEILQGLDQRRKQLFPLSNMTMLEQGRPTGNRFARKGALL